MKIERKLLTLFVLAVAATVLVLVSCDPADIIGDILNDPPIADAGGDQTVIVNILVELDGTNSDDPNEDPLDYTWEFIGFPPPSNLRDEDLSGRLSPFAYFTPDAEGKYILRLSVSDGSETKADDITITAVAEPAANEPPTAVAGADPTSIKEGESVSFDGTGSSDTDGTIQSWDWDFGDGATGIGETPAPHIYNTAGDYTVTLTVTDDGEAQDADTLVISVTPVATNSRPVAKISAPSEVTPVTSATFNGSSSYDPDAGGLIVSYAWDFGDGGTGSVVTLAHSYTAVDVYKVTLTVTDDKGATGVATHFITVQSAPPVTKTVTASLDIGHVFVSPEKVQEPINKEYNPLGWSNPSGGEKMATILFFDLSEFAGLGIVSATLELYVTTYERSLPAGTYEVYPMRAPWDESPVIDKGVSPWYDSKSPVDRAVITGINTRSPYKWDVSELVRAWVDEKLKNLGMVIVPITAVKEPGIFWSPHRLDKLYYPRLQIEYVK